MKTDYLDNIVWHNLAGPHARFAAGNANARRYARGFPAFAGFRDLERPDFDALAPHVEPGEQLYCDGWSGQPPAGWRVESECVLVTMTREAPPPRADDAPEVIRLDMRHAAAAQDLAMEARPGPFTPRTLELGEYFGIFAGSWLAAMAGARPCAGGLAEISGVCTHPGFRGAGMAERLVRKLVLLQMQNGRVPFLRVMQDNERACRLYQRMGFRVYRQSVARTVTRD